jgi:hypothetical protein
MFLALAIITVAVLRYVHGGTVDGEDWGLYWDLPICSQSEGATNCKMSPLEFKLRTDLVFVLPAFLPLLAYSFHFFRRQLRVAEMERIRASLHDEQRFQEFVANYHRLHRGMDFVLAVGIAWLVAAAGLAVLLIGTELGIGSWQGISGPSEPAFPIAGSRMVVGMAFLGGFLWGLGYLIQRLSANDLTPGAYDVGVYRMVFAAAVAFILFNAFGVAAVAIDVIDGSGATDGTNVWPALAFLLGVFPQRGFEWMRDRIPLLSGGRNPTVRKLDTDMIEGVEMYDKMRLEELGIESCYDLANADLFRLMLTTFYGARQLVDWILQAKLCMHCGDAVKDLRTKGLRWISDLKDQDLTALAQGTSATKESLERALKVGASDEIERLLRLEHAVGHLTPLK